MPRRRRLSKSQNRKNFRSGIRTHKKNLNRDRPMRGGIRL